LEGPGRVAHADTTGAPLHLFCCHGHPDALTQVAILRALVQADPTQVQTKDPNGCFPGTLLWRLYRNRCRRAAPNPEEGFLPMLFVLLAAVRGDGQEDGHSLSEVIAYQSRYAGPDRTDFCRLYLQAYPASVAVPHPTTGDWPVHTAAAAFPRHVTTTAGLVLATLTPDQAAVDPLWRLLQQAAGRATSAHPRPADGRLALQCALAQRQGAVGSLAQDVGLTALIQAWPAALQVPDPVSGLPAVALAAAADVGTGFLYDLLKCCPSVLPYSSPAEDPR
jgi:hypothetical protein